MTVTDPLHLAPGDSVTVSVTLRLDPPDRAATAVMTNAGLTRIARQHFMALAQEQADRIQVTSR